MQPVRIAGSMARQAGEPSDLSSHILPTSATMVGVCMTVLSIGRIAHAGQLGAFIERLLAIDAVMFLVSAVLSFVSIRVARRNARLERWAEELFLVGLTLTTVATVTIALTIDR